MQRKLMVALSVIASCFTSLFVMLFVLKEQDQEKFFVGYILLGLMFFGLCIWLMELARVRDERKKRIAKHKERRMKNEKISNSTERA